MKRFHFLRVHFTIWWRAGNCLSCGCALFIRLTPVGTETLLKTPPSRHRSKEIQRGGKKKGKEISIKQFKNRNGLHSSLKMHQTFFLCYSNREKWTELLWIAVQGLLLAFPQYTGWNPISVGGRKHSCRCFFLQLIKDVTLPELHSISPSDGDATDSRNASSLSAKQRLWEQNVTGHKGKQGGEIKRLLQIMNILWLKTKRKMFLKVSFS